ncbi:hypothetical protein [Glutamicibacter halophytocola]|uniref:hypothetical protein n=1 Tax=Glutamicibacter halophytocola TaxID=1933880 RepID=UPI0015C55544|nr:hypothetical protein [Glutamicibacter halophytocola]NQD40509.1 hypothetical protein [Glutamicibacter halophytocola]
MTQNNGVRPGTKLMNIGAWVAAIGAALLIFSIAMHTASALWIILLATGGVISLIGYLQRVLFALENKSASPD